MSLSKDWADIDNDDDLVESDGLVGHDDKGNRIITTYFRGADGRQMKRERKLAVTQRVYKVSSAVSQRQRSWVPFGIEALNVKERPEAKSWTTARAVNEEVFRAPKRLGLLHADGPWDNSGVGGSALPELNKRALYEIQRLFTICHDPDVKNLLSKVAEEKTEVAASNVHQVPERADRMNDAEDRTIRVSNLPDFVTEEEIRKLGNRCGNVSRHFLVRNKETNVSKGFAFITYNTKDEAASAIEKLNKRGLKGAVLSVEWARRRQPPVATQPVEN